MKFKVSLLLYSRQFGTLVGLLVLSLVLWVLTPYFMTLSNLLNIAEQTAVIAIVVFGMTFVIITAGIDMSVVSVLALYGVIMVCELHSGVLLHGALVSGWGAGLFCGRLYCLIGARGLF